MITVSGVGKAFGARRLFHDVTMQLDAPRRFGLVGANGSGKSTFLKMLSGEEPLSDGAITYARGARLGILRQDRFLNDSETVLEVAMQGDQQVHAALKRLHDLEGVANAVEEIGRLHDLIVQNEGYALESRASEILVGLGIPQASLREPLGNLSGGYKLRVLLAQVLIGRPDILLLDEPTNHLDILSISWLEKFLLGFSGLAVVISHDQRFLNAISTHILDVDYETIEMYTGDYQDFVRQKSEALTLKEAQIARQEKIIAEKQAFVDRFRAKATKARQAQSRVKQIEKIKVERLAPSSRREPKFAFTQARPSGRDVLKTEELCKAFGDNVVLSDVSLQIHRGERVAVIGANGLGKSTLLKLLASKLSPDSGTVTWGHETKVGYFPQNHADLLNKPKQTPLEMVWEGCPLEQESTVRGQLGRVLFTGDDVKKPVAALSGGEAARLIFARIAVEKPNVLLLDEPTNHLDMEAIEALARALNAYPGTTIFVSHDRWFVGQLATRILEVKKEGIANFPGTYEEYLASQGDDHLNVQAVVQQAKEAKVQQTKVQQAKVQQAKAQQPKEQKVAAQEDPESKLSWEDRKKLQNRRKTLPRLREAVLAKIHDAEQRKQAIVDGFAEEGFFERTDPDVIKKLRLLEIELASQIDGLMTEWEDLEKELVALGEG